MSLRLTQVQRGYAGVLLAGLLATSFGANAQAQADATAPPAWQTPAAKTGAEHARLQREAQQVTITRDDWGIAHVHGKTDADAVFGMIYAQCEDDFNRVEMNFLTALGWSAQAEGESAIWDNLRYQLFIDPVALKQDYTKSPTWLKKLMNAWADGMNWYLATHPDVHQRHRNRAEAHRRRPRASADQPARHLQFPQRVADLQRRRPRCLRRLDLGPVLHLPRLQQAHRLDAHFHRRRRGRRIRRNHFEEGRQVFLQIW